MRFLGATKAEAGHGVAIDGRSAGGERVAGAGGAPYKPWLYGADFKWSFGQEGNNGHLKFDLLRIWDDNSPGQARTVGSISNVNGVWLDWTNPSGFYSAQINRGGPADIPAAANLAGSGSTSDFRPILPTHAGGTAIGIFGQDQDVGAGRDRRPCDQRPRGGIEHAGVGVLECRAHQRQVVGGIAHRLGKSETHASVPTGSSRRHSSSSSRGASGSRPMAWCRCWAVCSRYWL